MKINFIKENFNSKFFFIISTYDIRGRS